MLNLTIEEKIKYSNLDDSFKDELYELLDSSIRGETKDEVVDQLNESKFIIEEDRFEEIKYLLKTKNKNKQEIIDDIEEAVVAIEDLESELRESMNYHLEIIKQMQDLLK